MPSLHEILSVRETYGAWTPSDQSGAGLAFAIALGRWVRHKNLVTALVTIQWPVTANGANTLVGGLPFTTTNTDPVGGGYVVETGSGLAFTLLCVNNATTFRLEDNTGTRITNAQMSNTYFRGVIIYRTTP